MMGRKFSKVLVISFGIVFLCCACGSKKEVELQTQQENLPIKEVAKKVETVVPKKNEKKYDLYSTTPYDLPMYSIVEISKLPVALKDSVDKILEKSQGFYLLRKDNDKLFIILQNPVTDSDTFLRHNLQFAEIDLNGNIQFHTAGYHGEDGETANSIKIENEDAWNFEENVESPKPLKHIAYDENGKVKFTEIWNYGDQDSVKYQMLDSKGNVMSILKESQDNDSNLRQEHVFYDNNGNTTMSFSVNYDGANVSRVTYYNSHDSIDSMSIISEYSDGVKTKEQIYNEDYELINTITSSYKDGERKEIKVFDKNGTEMNKISS